MINTDCVKVDSLGIRHEVVFEMRNKVWTKIYYLVSCKVWRLVKLQVFRCSDD